MPQACHRNLIGSRELFQSRHEFTAGVSGRTDTPELREAQFRPGAERTEPRPLAAIGQ